MNQRYGVIVIFRFVYVLGGSTGGGTGDGGSSQPATGRIMLSNLQIFSQFVTSLIRMSSEMMYIGMGQVVFPAEEVADLSPSPPATRAAMYITEMGLWRPQTGPGDPRPVPTSSCNACMTCLYCLK